MKWHRLFPSFCFLFVFISSFVLAQRLPEGEYHTNRTRHYDLLHYKAELSFDFDQHQLSGTAAMSVRPLGKVDTLRLDAIHLQVKRVVDENGNSLQFRNASPLLEIFLPESNTSKDTLALRVEYQAVPKAGMYFQPDLGNPKRFYVTTYGEGGLHANWLPIYNDVNDKFSSEMIVTVPPPYSVISNGTLVAKDTLPDGNLRFHWQQNLPHPNYLIALYVGEFEMGELSSAFGSIPLRYWAPSGRLQEGAYAFRNTTRMVEHFSTLLDYKYPWDKYDQVAVPDYAIGAMEHTGVTGHRASVLRDESAPLDFSPVLESYTDDWSAEATISHELAHHWFGNNLTCRNLSFIWLNESFASYLMMLWDEESVGSDQLLFDLWLAKQHYFEYVHKEHVIRPLEYHEFDDPNTIYNTEHTYLKGAAVLHMLRRILGDEPFFNTLGHYLHKHEFSNVESQDLKIAIEEVTGENLEWFFDQWITGAGHPIIEASYRYLPDKKQIILSVDQVQSFVRGQGVFTLPVTITLATKAKTWQEQIWLKKEKETFALACDDKPFMVSFDGEGSLVAEVSFEKEIEELNYQAKHDAVPGRLWAIRALAESYPHRSQTLRVFEEIIASSNFWAVRAEASQQLGSLRVSGAEAAIAKALKDGDYRVRKAAVLALPKFGTSSAEQKLRDVIRNDRHDDVVAAAIVALAKANPKLETGFLEQQLGRKSWYDEISLAVLQAMKHAASKKWISTLTKYATGPYNQHVRSAALSAWEACDPNDNTLHRLLIELTASPSYSLQQHAIGALGRLYVSEARDELERMVEENVDPNLTKAAREALDEIAEVK